MNDGWLPYNLIKRVCPGDLENYLSTAGWKQVPNVPGLMTVFRRPESEDEEVYVPQRPEVDDYGRRVIEAVSDLAEFEHREPFAVLIDLLPPHIKNRSLASLFSDPLETAV